MLVNEILLNNYRIPVKSYEEEKTKDGNLVTVTFDVTSEEYHDVTTLLYKGVFDVKIPEKNRELTGRI